MIINWTVFSFKRIMQWCKRCLGIARGTHRKRPGTFTSGFKTGTSCQFIKIKTSLKQSWAQKWSKTWSGDFLLTWSGTVVVSVTRSVKKRWAVILNKEKLLKIFGIANFDSYGGLSLLTNFWLVCWSHLRIKDILQPWKVEHKDKDKDKKAFFERLSIKGWE